MMSIIGCWNCEGFGHVGHDADGKKILCEFCAHTGQIGEDDLDDAALALDRIVWANSGRRRMTETDMDEAVAALEAAIQSFN